MMNDKHKDKSYQQRNPTKRAERVESSGTQGSKKHNPSSRQATTAAGESVIKETQHAEVVDAVSADQSLGIAESRQRDQGISIPDTPYKEKG
jgi:hypothetical protein